MKTVHALFATSLRQRRACTIRGGFMAGDLIAATSGILETGNGTRHFPTLVVEAGGDALKRFIEFFAAQIRHRNTREAYIRAIVDFFDWTEEMDVKDVYPKQESLSYQIGAELELMLLRRLVFHPRAPDGIWKGSHEVIKQQRESDH